MDGTRSALIVASDDYTDPGLRQLRAPARDAEALAMVLRDPAIGGFEVRTLLNQPAHEVNLAVEEFFADRRPGDLLLVHFSCHGVKDEAGELYFAASNTMLRRLGATAVAAEFVSRRMSRSRSRRVVLLLDCCYAGAFERGLAARASTEMGIEQQFGGRGRAVITASSAMEYAFEGGELTDTRMLGPSVFTRALVEGLKTGDADRDQDGLVALDELYDYVYDKVRTVTPNQTPGKWTFGVEGELYIARRSRPVTTPAALPPALQHAIESPLAGIRGGAVQELERILHGRHAGLALAARRTLERLTEDDSRVVAAAATAALASQAPSAPPEPASPGLALSVTVIDFGRLHLHSQSPERRVDIRNLGGGSLNARAETSASWLKVRQAEDGLVVTVDTSATGEHEGTITVNSNAGSATIRVQARVEPPPQPTPEPASTTHPRLGSERPNGARSGRQQDAMLGKSSPATTDRAPPVTITPPAPAAPPDGVAVGPAQGSHGIGRGIARRWVITAAAAAGVVVIGLLIAIIIVPGTPPRHVGTPTQHVRWIYKTGGQVSSSPAVSDGTVYVGSQDGKVYALDAATGHVRWTYTTGDQVSSSPAVVGGTVYVGSQDGKVYALDAATGVALWAYPTGRAIFSSPAVVGGTVYVGSEDGKVYALNAGSGHVRWTYPTGGHVNSSPAVVGGTVYIGSHDHKVYALNAATGEVRWIYTTGDGVYSSPAVVGGTIYVGSYDHKVYALNAATGDVRWVHVTTGAVLSSPTVVDGVVYVGSSDQKVYALDATTGDIRWAYTTGSSVYSSPVVAGGTVYIGSFDHKVYALKATDGDVRWTYTTGGQVYSSPAAANTVYIGSYDGNVYALKAG
jgi:outer membrane protein assembly factor BamB